MCGEKKVRQIDKLKFVIYRRRYDKSVKEIERKILEKDLEEQEQLLKAKREFSRWRVAIDTFVKEVKVERVAEIKLKTYEEMSGAEKQAYVKRWNDLKKHTARKNGLIIPESPTDRDMVVMHNNRKTMKKGVDYFEITGFSGHRLCFAYSKEGYKKAMYQKSQYVSEEEHEMILLCYYEARDMFESDEKLAYNMYMHGFKAGYTHFMSLKTAFSTIADRTQRYIYEKLYPTLFNYLDFIHECECNGVEWRTAKGGKTNKRPVS